MADVLRIKRRVSPAAVGAPASLQNAELAYNENDHTLYIGEGTGGAGGSATVIRAIGGDGLVANNAPVAAEYVVAALHASLSNERLLTNTTTITWDFATAGQVKANLALSYAVISGSPVNGQLAQWSSATAIQGVNFSAISRSAWGVPTADVPWGSFKITGLSDPANPQDAATKAYVDAAAQGLDAKQSVRVASTTNIASLSGLLVVDGVTTVAGDRVLVKNQPGPTNGIYIASVGVWPRSPDMDTWAEIPSAYVFVEGGATNADTGWLCTSDPGGTLLVDNITWVQFSGAGQITAGNGLTKTGNTLDAVGTAGRILVSADSIDIDGSWVGQGSISTVGSITTGAWNATTISVARGGTSAATFTAGYLKSPGATGAFTTVATIPNTDISGLGTMSTQNAGAVAITGGTVDGVTFDCGTF
jgi:hypothetical protein